MTPMIAPAIGSLAVAGVVATVATPVAIHFLKKFSVVDVASARSSHEGMAIRGVGVATLFGFGAGLTVAVVSLPISLQTQILTTLGLIAVSITLIGLLEDISGLPITIRASAQMLVSFVGLGAYSWWADAPLWIAPLGAVVVAGYTNASNFMDGINGISGIHGLVGGSYYLILGLQQGQLWMQVAGGTIAVVFAVFLPWNILRSGTFLGDSGSYLLGSALALTALLSFTMGVHFLAALGPLVVYGLDVGYTLAKRIMRGERWYEPHRTHVYQQLSRTKLGHVGTSVLVGAFTAAVAISALASSHGDSSIGLVGSIGLVIFCVGYIFLPKIARLNE